MALQLSHKNTSFSAAKNSLIIICDNIISPANVGGLFRLCDALGLEAIYFCQNIPDLNSVRLKRTSRNTHGHIKHRNFDQTIDAINVCIKNGYEIIALELTQSSLPLTRYINNDNTKIALVLGNEKHGVSEKILKNIDCHMHIEMCGKNSSMNVVQAAAIACYSLTKI